MKGKKWIRSNSVLDLIAITVVVLLSFGSEKSERQAADKH